MSDASITNLSPRLRYARQQCQSVDQTPRRVPINLRQSGPTPTELLISTRVRKSPYWHLSQEAGCWRATVYNRMYHPRGYVRPEDGGAMVEYRALMEDVTLWNVAVERQIRVQGPDAEAFVDKVITRNASAIAPLHGKYVILCNDEGGIINDPVLLRLAEDEFWFSISDSDLELWLRGVNLGLGYDVSIGEIDVAPLQIQGPRSEALMVDLVGEAVRTLPYYGLLEATIAGCSVVVSQTGFTGEKGYEIYLREASRDAESLWEAVLAAGEKHNLAVIAPAHHRRIAAGILSWGQDMDQETLPFQCNLGYQVPRQKAVDYIGRHALEAVRTELDQGRYPFRQTLVGLVLGGHPIDDYAPDFWLISDLQADEPIGYVTSPWYSPELGTNIAMGYVPVTHQALETPLRIWLPEPYAERPGEPVAARVVDLPFRASVNPSAREAARSRGQDTAL
ncbi:glycine cleavage T C-terminal barrel domain-containing protein [Bisbaumannia pacifica]|uniref:Aminomethyl transferase family protein n=1 Tax=Bisbaumannia pacifica TaxID=77098 RepID=A0ABD4KW75_9GAMM|nr:glycine cleavage T C-terminal barrel domain-containing protein [Halomonas pacifica]MBH8578591.1 aminomethyl transferase family protein [Halomonas pacifica]